MNSVPGASASAPEIPADRPKAQLNRGKPKSRPARPADNRPDFRAARERAAAFTQEWNEDRDTAVARFVGRLGEAQLAAKEKSGPARRRTERTARKRGRQAPVRRGPDRLGRDPRQNEVDAWDLLTPLEQAEVSATRQWVRDWDAERPTDNSSLTLAQAANASASLRSSESLQESLSRVRGHWCAHSPTEAAYGAPEVADAPSATNGAAASERPANNVGAAVGRVPKDHRKPAGQAADKRDSHHHLREDLQPRRTTDRLKGCGVKPTAGSQIAVKASATTGMAHFSGLQSCASIWACPVCGPKIRAERARELETFAAAWIARDGWGGWKGKGGLLMGTFTFQHHRRLDLDPLLDKLADAWRRMLQYKRYRRLKDEHGLVGFTRAEELTHGRNGWHPHLHVLFWLPKHMSQKKADLLRAEFFAMWLKACDAVGLGKPTEKHGVDLKTVARGKEGAKQLARYIAKIEGPDGVERPMGQEMMRGDLKTGRRAESRTPFEIAQAWADAPDKTVKSAKRDLALWLEYERATHGHKAVTWSRGLKQLLQELLDIVEDDRTNDEIAAEEPVDSSVVVFIPREVWYRHIVHQRGRRTQLLHAYERLGIVGLRTVADSWGLVWGRDIRPYGTGLSEDRQVSEQVSAKPQAESAG